LEQGESKASAANVALESLKHEMESALTEQTTRASEAAGRAAEATASKGAADAEVARLDVLCQTLIQGDEARGLLI